MSSSESRADIMKPLLIKAGILSIGAYIFAKFISKRPHSKIDPSSTQTRQNCPENDLIEDCESFHSLNSASLDGITEDSQIGCTSNLEHKLLELESRLEHVQNKEFDMKSRYLRYRVMKEKELMLTEIKNEMLLEKTRAEFLVKEIYLADEELKRVGNLVINFIRLFYKFQGLKKENALLQRKVRKLCRRDAHRLMVTRKQKREIESKDYELMRNGEEIEGRDCVIQEIEDENKGLKEVIDHLQREKIELFINKVDLVENSPPLDKKVEITESVSKEEYDKVLNELEQVQKDGQSEANEITYLKWSNACLRHELLRYQERNKDDNDDEKRRVEFDEHQSHENGNCNNITTSKRRRFIKKIKKWVEGGHTYEKEKNGSGKHYVPQVVDDQFVQARMSFSSV